MYHTNRLSLFFKSYVIYRIIKKPKAHNISLAVSSQSCCSRKPPESFFFLGGRVLGDRTANSMVLKSEEGVGEFEKRKSEGATFSVARTHLKPRSVFIVL